jgi:hypothetical protein
VRDVALVAWFELFRAVRTWRAVALLVLYGVAAAGAGYLFVQFVGLMEGALADNLGVARTQTPGAMMDDLLQSEQLVEVLSEMVGSEEVAEQLLSVPLVALFHLWLGFLLVPFFAASASAESIASDLRTRALRFEVLRTGRLELVLGRFAGQLLLTGVATGVASAVMWCVAVGFMAGLRPVALAGWLVWFALRTWAFSVPFVGIGIAASQLTASSAWARVMAIGATGATWVAYGTARWLEDERAPILADLLLQVLPQGWIQGMWDPSGGWVVSSLACSAVGVAVVALGYLRFARRDL